METRDSPDRLPLLFYALVRDDLYGDERMMRFKDGWAAFLLLLKNAIGGHTAGSRR